MPRVLAAFAGFWPTVQCANNLIPPRCSLEVSGPNLAFYFAEMKFCTHFLYALRLLLRSGAPMVPRVGPRERPRWGPFLPGF